MAQKVVWRESHAHMKSFVPRGQDQKLGDGPFYVADEQEMPGVHIAGLLIQQTPEGPTFGPFAKEMFAEAETAVSE